MNIVESGKFAVQASLGLLIDRPQYPSIKRRPLLNELASTSSKEPLNREENILDKFVFGRLFVENALGVGLSIGLWNIGFNSLILNHHIDPIVRKMRQARNLFFKKH